MSRMWHYVRNGQPQSPVPEEQLRALRASSALRAEDLVWREGLPAWIPAGQVPELTPQAPPPPAYLPPPPPAFAPPPPPAYAPAPQPYPTPATFPGPGPFAAPGAPSAAGGPSPVALDLLRKTRPWTRLLGVLGALGLGFILLAALFMAIGATPPFNAMPPGPRLVAALLYVLMAFLQLPPVIFLNRYASRITDLLATGTMAELEAALAAQKAFWKYVGILTLIGILLSVVAIPAAFLIPLLMK